MLNNDNNRTNYLLKNTTIFAISNISTKIIVFFLIPLYTRKLSTTDYGIVDLLFTIGSFLYPLFTLNIVEAVFRFSMDKNKDDNKIIYNGVLCNILCIVISLILIPIMKVLNIYSNYATIFYFYLISLSISQTILSFLKGQEKLRLFAYGNILNTIVIALLSIIFLTVLNLSTYGYFLAYIISNILTIIYCIIFGKININFNIKNYDINFLVKMLKYSVVLIPTSFMWWIINSSDRIMIASFIGNDANGLYAIAYKIPSILTMLASIFNQAWVFSAINEKNSSDYEKYTNSIFSNLFIVLVLTSIVLLIFIKPLFSFYISPKYYDSWKYVPFLIFGYVFMTLSTFISTAYNVNKDSKGFLLSGMVGAIINILLNLVLIPVFGVYGAAFATVLSYISVFLYRLFDTKKYVKININYNHFLLIIMLTFSCTIVYMNGLISVIGNLSILILIIIIYRKRIAKILGKFYKQKK